MSLKQVRTTMFSSVGVSSASTVTVVPWWDILLLATSRLSSVKDINRWNKSSGRSSTSSFMLAKSKKCAPVDWKPKWALIACPVELMDVEFFTIVLREITGQKLAICPNMSSRWKFFWKAVRRRVAGTSSPSEARPLWGAADDFFSHVELSAKNWAKLGSREREYWRFCPQASNVVTVSFFVRGHWFGALLEFIL